MFGEEGVEFEEVSAGLSDEGEDAVEGEGAIATESSTTTPSSLDI